MTVKAKKRIYCEVVIRKGTVPINQSMEQMKNVPCFVEEIVEYDKKFISIDFTPCKNVTDEMVKDKYNQILRKTYKVISIEFFDTIDLTVKKIQK